MASTVITRAARPIWPREETTSSLAPRLTPRVTMRIMRAANWSLPTHARGRLRRALREPRKAPTTTRPM